MEFGRLGLVMLNFISIARAAAAAAGCKNQSILSSAQSQFRVDPSRLARNKLDTFEPELELGLEPSVCTFEPRPFRRAGRFVI